MQDTMRFAKSMVAAIVGYAAYLLGGLDTILTTLIVVISLDYLSGVLKAVYLKRLSSEIGFRGIAKKCMSLMVVALAYLVEGITGAALPLREVVIVFFIANEGISILENAAQTGIPIPKRLRETLAQLQGKEGDTSD